MKKLLYIFLITFLIIFSIFNYRFYINYLRNFKGNILYNFGKYNNALVAYNGINEDLINNPNINKNIINYNKSVSLITSFFDGEISKNIIEKNQKNIKESKKYIDNIDLSDNNDIKFKYYFYFVKGLIYDLNGRLIFLSAKDFDSEKCSIIKTYFSEALNYYNLALTSNYGVQKELIKKLFDDLELINKEVSNLCIKDSNQAEKDSSNSEENTKNNNTGSGDENKTYNSGSGFSSKQEELQLKDYSDYLKDFQEKNKDVINNNTDMSQKEIMDNLLNQFFSDRDPIFDDIIGDNEPKKDW